MSRIATRIATRIIIRNASCVLVPFTLKRESKRRDAASSRALHDTTLLHSSADYQTTMDGDSSSDDGFNSPTASTIYDSSDDEQLLADNEQTEPTTPSLLDYTFLGDTEGHDDADNEEEHVFGNTEKTEEPPSPPQPKRLKLTKTSSKKHPAEENNTKDSNAASDAAGKDDAKKLTPAETMQIQVGDRVFSEFPVEGPHHRQWYWGQVKRRFRMKHKDDGNTYCHYKVSYIVVGASMYMYMYMLNGHSNWNSKIVYDDGDMVQDFDPTVYGISIEKWVQESSPAGFSLGVGGGSVPDVGVGSNLDEPVMVDIAVDDDSCSDDELFGEEDNAENTNQERYESNSFPNQIAKSKLPVKSATGFIDDFDEQGSEIPVIKYEVSLIYYVGTIFVVLISPRRYTLTLPLLLLLLMKYVERSFLSPLVFSWESTCQDWTR
jgi:hypothetical protein